jgi:DNA-binding MarR family transcriptional regulator
MSELVCTMDDVQRVNIATQANRFKILEILAKDSTENNSTERLATLLKLNPKTTAFHLKALEDADLVEGKFILLKKEALKCYFLTKRGREIFSRLEGLK